MIAAQAMRRLADLLAPRPRGFSEGRYRMDVIGTTRIGLSRASAASGIDGAPVAAAIRSRVDPVLASQPNGATYSDDRQVLSILALLDMMTSNEARRLVLTARNAPHVAAYCATYNLDMHLLPRNGQEGPAPDRADRTLLAVGLSLEDVSDHLADIPAAKGIVVAAPAPPETTLAFTQRLPHPADEIATGIDLGAGATVAWLWPRL